MILDPYGVMSYGRSEELRSPYRRVKKSVRTCDIIYERYGSVYV